MQGLWWMTTWNFTTWQILQHCWREKSMFTSLVPLIYDTLHAQILICIFLRTCFITHFSNQKNIPSWCDQESFPIFLDAGLIKLMALLEEKIFNNCFDNLTHMDQNNSTYYDSPIAFVRLQSSEIYMYYAVRVLILVLEQLTWLACMTDKCLAVVLIHQ